MPLNGIIPYCPNCEPELAGQIFFFPLLCSECSLADSLAKKTLDKMLVRFGEGDQ